MKKILLIGLFSMIAFTMLTLLTHQNDLAVDGFNSYGFPFNFYRECSDCYPDYGGGFNLQNLILDALFSAIVAVFLFVFSMKILRK